jgi:hypothetical protein
MKSALNNPSLKSLEAFRATIETDSATAAAKTRGITQPGISRLLVSSEGHVGFALFYREKGRLFPTQEVLALYKRSGIDTYRFSLIDLFTKRSAIISSGALSEIAIFQRKTPKLDCLVVCINVFFVLHCFTNSIKGSVNENRNAKYPY